MTFDGTKPKYMYRPRKTILDTVNLKSVMSKIGNVEVGDFANVSKYKTVRLGPDKDRKKNIVKQLNYPKIDTTQISAKIKTRRYKKEKQEAN